MFRATVCPSSGETVTWYLLFCVDDCLVCRITSIKCRINTVVSPDDGRTVARNMQRLINILRINCTPVGFIYKIIQRCTVNRT